MTNLRKNRSSCTLRGVYLKGFTSSLGRDASRIFNHEPSPLDIFPSTIQSASIEQSLLSPSPCIVGYTKFGKLLLMRFFFLYRQETHPKPLTSKRQVVLSKKDQGMDDSFRNLEPSPSTFLYHMRAKFPIRIPSKAFIRISISVP